MSFKTKFLELEMISQIKYSVFLLSVIYTFIILALIAAYCYEIINQSYRQQKQFFKDIDTSTTENIIQFQNFQFLLYEDLTKTAINQILTYLSANSLYVESETKVLFNENEIKTFFINAGNSTTCQHSLCLFYESIIDPFTNNNITFMFNVVKMIPIIESISRLSMLFMGNDNKLIETFNFYIKDHNISFCTKDQFSNIDYNEIINQTKHYYNDFKSERNTEDYYLINELYESLDLSISNLNQITSSQPIMNYFSNNIINIDKLENNIVLGFFKDEFLDRFFRNIILGFKGYTSIPTVFSIDKQKDVLKTFIPCYYFLLLQKNETLTNFEENTEISISECFQNESTKKEIESFIFNHTLQNQYSSFMLSNFYQMKYLSFEKGKKLQTYLTLKTPYPDYNSLLLYQPNYISFNNFTLYSFSSHFPVKLKTKQIEFLLHNVLFLLLLVSLFTWHIMLLILFFLTKRLSKQVTEPIKNLRASVESMTFTDASIFTYKDDDIINDLFGTCRDLLKGALVVKQNKIDDDYKKSEIGSLESNNIIVNQEVVAQYQVDENILRYKSGYIDYFDKGRTKEKKASKKLTSLDGNGSDAMKTGSDYYDKLIEISKEVFDIQNGVNVTKDRDGNIFKNKKCILYERYLAMKKKNKNYVNSGIQRLKSNTSRHITFELRDTTNIKKTYTNQ